MNKRTVEILTLLTGSLLLTMLISNMIAYQPETGTKVVPKSIVIAQIMMGTLFSKWTMVVALVFLAMFVLYLRQHDFDFNISIKPRQTMNFLVYLYISTFFFVIPIPGVLLSFALLLLCIAAPPRNRINANMRPFWIVLSCFLFLETKGLMYVWLGFDDIRKQVSLAGQVLHITSFLNALIVYYVIKRNNWGFKEFETFFKILIYCTVIIALESIVTFYLGIGTGISVFGYPPLFRGEMFQSVLIGRYHIAGRLGITLFFISMYFSSKYRDKRYVLFSILGFLLLFSTLNRQVIAASIAGFVLLLLLNRNKRPAVNVTNRVFKLCAALIVLAVFAAISVYLMEQILSMRDTGGAAFQLVKRSIRWARGADVFLYTFPFGTGSGMVTYFLGSSLVPWEIAEWYGRFFDYDPDRIQKLIVSKKHFMLFEIEAGHTVHNLWVRTILEFGLLGLFFIVYLWRKGLKIFVHLYRLQKKVSSGINLFRVWVVFMLVFSISLSVSFTDKFRSYWYFAMLFAFLELCVKNASFRFKQQQLKSETSIINK